MLLAVSPFANAQTCTTPCQSFTSTSGLSIPASKADVEWSAVSVQANAFAAGATIQKVTVTLNDWSETGFGGADRQFVLQAPNGHVFEFAAGTTTDASFNNETYTLDDSASTALPYTGFSAAAPASGTYKPNISSAFTSYCGDYPSSPTYSPGPAPSAYDAAGTQDCPAGGNSNKTFATNFSGGTPFGTWVLFVYTNNNDDNSGTVSSWTLSITPAVAAGTTTSLSSSEPESFSGTSVTFTATVTSSSNPVTSGTVTFTDSYNNATLCSGKPVNGSGQATCFVSLSGEGNHAITATYSGDSNFATSNGGLTQVVDNQTQVTGAQFCNPGAVSFGNNAPTSVYPQNVFVAGLAGSVTGVALTLNNVNAYPSDLDLLLTGPNGDRFVPLADAGGISSRVNGITLTLSDTAGSHVPVSGLTASGSYLPTDYQSNISFPAPAPSGSYSLPFNQGSATFASTFASEVVSGAAPVTMPNNADKWSLYIRSLTASDVGSTGGYCLTFITSNLTSTTTSVSASPSPATTGQNVTFTATVTNAGTSAPVTSGTVTFEENGTVVAGPSTLNGGGQATYQTASLAEGIHNITALYSGVANSFNVSSGSASVEVDTPTTQTGSTYCNPSGVNISSSATQASPYPSRVNVTNFAGTVKSVSVSLDAFDGASPDELLFLLTGPTGTNIGFLDDAGGLNNTGSINLTFADGGTALSPTSELANGATYAPTADNNLSAISFPAPAPASVSYAAPLGSQTFASAFSSIPPAGYWSLYAFSRETNEGMSLGKWCLNFTANSPVLTLTKSHTGSFTQGDASDSYTITVANTGPGSTAGALTLTDTLPAGLSAVSMSQTGSTGGGTGADWNCTGATCSRTTAMQQGETDTITLVVSVSYGAAIGTNAVTNSVSVSGGGISATQTATDPTTINAGAGFTLSTTVNPASSGTVVANPANSTGLPAGHYAPGTVVTLTASPTAGYAFSSWNGGADLSSTTANPTTITMNANEGVTANFTQTVANVSGSVSVTSSGLTYNRLKKQGSETITITNTGGTAVTGPIQLVLGIAGSGVTAANSTGTYNGNPYWTAQAGSLAPGASASITVTFSYTAGTNFTTSSTVYSGSF